MDKQEIVVAQHGSLPAPVVTNTQWAERRKMFNEWVNTQLRDNVDFGKVPGTDKPTLLKPGAEKILQLYGCSVETETTHREQDITTGYLNIEVAARAVSIQTGMVVGVGLGSCSTYESKYRWRWENWKDKRNGPPADQGWEQASGKWGAYWRRRTENRDLFDQWNTVLKMAKKRALVDLALTISGASEKFTQDVEDMREDSAPTAEEHQAAAGDPPAKAEPPKAASSTIVVDGDQFNPTATRVEVVRSGNGQHWTRTGEAGAFMKRMAEKTGLTYATIQNAALNVGAITQYTGTLADAEKAVDDFVFEQSKAKTEPEPSQLTM